MGKSCVLHFSQRTFQTLYLFVFLLLVAEPCLEGATFTVLTTTPDANIPGTLRFAMNSANAAGADTILFNIPGAGPHVIAPDSQLPILTDQAGVFIDGLSEPGSSVGANPPTTANLMIVIDGINAGTAHGIWIRSSNNIVQGLVVHRFQQDGIRIQARPEGSHFNYVYCNFVGTDQTGSVVQGNGTNQQGLWGGIYIVCVPGYPGLAYNNMVDRNLSSGNYAEGIGISSCPPGDVAYNTVVHNYVGTDVGGTVDRGNVHDGVYIGEGAHDNLVDGNLISGNDFEGVCIVGWAEATPPVTTYANIVANNIIGLNITQAPLPNTRDGVSIGIYGTYHGGYATDNIIAVNTIAHNSRNGVMVWEHLSSATNADGNQITQNSIYNNSMLGVDLGDNGVTSNDPGDLDVGPNEEVNFPVISSAVVSGGQTTISGSLNINTNPVQAIVEVFKVSSDPSGYGEGRTYLGFTNPDAAGSWNITVSGLAAGDTVTATTTDVNFNTSEFAQNFVVNTGIAENTANTTPRRFELGQNYPNPFSRSTTIPYTLCEEARVKLTIYDVSGRTVKTLLDDYCSELYHILQWDGTDVHGHMASPGVYIYVLENDKFKAMRKMIMAR